MRRAVLAMLTCALAFGASPTWADDDDDDDGRRYKRQRPPSFCSRTADLLRQACRAEAADDFLTTQAICLNVEDDADRRECFDEAKQARGEQRDLCREQNGARRDLCELVGEERYDPDFDAESFSEVFDGRNPYFPIVVGNQWAYSAGDETNVVTVVDETKHIEGVTCIVVTDIVTAEDFGESTDDWYGQALNGDVWYCGEEVQDFEVFEGDDPQVLELVSIDGSFKHGRDGDRAGIQVPARPELGKTHLQEVSVGNAEDHATVISTGYGYGRDPELDRFVPRALAEQYCPDHDCLVTRDGSPIEPGVFERKYYARGVGVFLEVKPASGETNQLVGCNVHPKCSPLP